MSPIDLSAIVADSAELYEPVADEAGLALTSSIEPGIEVQGNRELIGQAIFNLIDNAIKYSADAEGARRYLAEAPAAVPTASACPSPIAASGVPPTEARRCTEALRAAG